MTGLEWAGHDVRYGLRAMRRNPAFTAIAAASLAIGIGANTTMFSAVDALLIRTPAHVKDAARIHRVYFELPATGGGTNVISTLGYRVYAALRDRVSGFEAVGAFSREKLSSGRGADARLNIEPVSRRLAPQLRPWRLGASMFSAFGVLALCLAAVGLYGLVSYLVAQRAHEIGVRKALGAADGDVVRLVLREAVGMTGAGVIAGVIIALATGRFVAGQLYGVGPNDARVMLLGTGVLVVVAIIACLAPARRAMRVDPIVALRAD